MADNPNIQWALDILTVEPDYKPSLLSEYGLLVLAPIVAVMGGMMENAMHRKPFYAHIPKLLIGALIIIPIAMKHERSYPRFLARSDQYLREYVIQHPEDFPPPERKKWAEVLEPWHPVR